MAWRGTELAAAIDTTLGSFIQQFHAALQRAAVVFVADGLRSLLLIALDQESMTRAMVRREAAQAAAIEALLTSGSCLSQVQRIPKETRESERARRGQIRPQP